MLCVVELVEEEKVVEIAELKEVLLVLVEEAGVAVSAFVATN
jgi:hypothetical protein